jgi:hypothetical protein
MEIRVIYGRRVSHPSINSNAKRLLDGMFYTEGFALSIHIRRNLK